MTEVASTRYWCHVCEHSVDIEESMAEEMKCSFCDGGFIEEMVGQEFEGLTSQRSERDLSQWGTSDNLFEQPGGTADSEDEEEDDDADDMGHEFEGFIRRHRRASALRRVLDSIQDDLRADRERDNSILINAFNQALALQGSVLDPDEVRDDQASSSNDDGLLEEYVLGAGLSLLLQHLAESDPNRYGTPPAKKEVVEALPTVTVEEVVNCSVCLDDLELGSRQSRCLVSISSTHCVSCHGLNSIVHALCAGLSYHLKRRKDLNEPSNVDRTESIHEELRADGPGNDSESSNRAWALVPWFNGLFSAHEPETTRGAFTDQQPPSATGTDPNTGES